MEFLTADQPVAPQYFPHTATKNWVSCGLVRACGCGNNQRGYCMHVHVCIHLARYFWSVKF